MFDTCKVFSIHGIPGILGGLIGGIVTITNYDTFIAHRKLESNKGS